VVLVADEPEAPVSSALGGRIRQAREALGLRPIDLAEAAGLSRSLVHDLETGRPRDLGVSKFYKLAQCLGVTMEYLLDEPDLAARMRPDDWFDHINWEEPLWSALDDAGNNMDLPDEDVRMLAAISYRGQRPTTVDQWCLLYSMVRLVIQHADAWAWNGKSNG
jgi:transcriptional regulator with XRE-family HTH domain